MPTILPSFEVMAHLARTDPPAFEAMRKKLTQDAIARVRNDVRRRRLQGLQFQIDMERRKSSSPMAGCIRISQMMSESLLELHQAFNGCSGQGVSSSVPNSDATSARILDFPEAALKVCIPEGNKE